jgi:Leucine-rich repeat (LRR) protein
LSIPKNQIFDLSPLATLSRVEILDLDNNQISDLSNLRKFYRAKEISLKNNKLSDEEQEMLVGFLPTTTKIVFK